MVIVGHMVTVAHTKTARITNQDIQFHIRVEAGVLSPRFCPS